MPTARASISTNPCVRANDIIALRPGVGLSPDRELDLIGRVLLRDISAGAPFLEGDIVQRSGEAARVA